MNTSILLAKIAGPCLLALCIYMLADKKNFTKMIDEMAHSHLLLVFVSFYNMVLGLLVVLFHNIWAWNYQGLITILGWSILLKGALFLLFPGVLMKQAESFRKMGKLYSGAAAFFLVIGIYLGYVGYFAG